MHRNCPIKTAGSGLWRKRILTILLLISIQPVIAQSAYIKKYKPLADSLAKEYEIPVAVILGVAIIESGSGTSRNSKLLNNHFGIVGKNDLYKTKKIKSRYKQFKTVEDSYVAFCKLLKKKKYYDKLKGNMDYKLWLEAMAKAGYTEAPEEWKKRITSAIKKFKLAETH